MSTRLAVWLYFCFGMIQTVAGYLLFNRTPDHQTFLALANFGIDPGHVPSHSSLLEFKEQSYSLAYYILASPSRLLGGHELIHLLWFRFLTLLGFYYGFKGLYQFYGFNSNRIKFEKNLKAYLLLILIYPGQFAWTTSLLRDGAGTSFFLFALYCWSMKKNMFAMAMLGISVLFRIEFLVILVWAIFYRLVLNFSFVLKHPRLSLVGICLVFSLLFIDHRHDIINLSTILFGELGANYPNIDNILDVTGFGLFLLQAIIDPISLFTPFNFSVFMLAECIFFLYVLSRIAMTIQYSRGTEKLFLLSTLTTLWVYAYFEMMVGGFSRHRMLLVAILLVSVSFRRTRVVFNKQCKKNPSSLSHEMTN